ncbi:MAG: helix-turn-helix domain-containing protein [Opitutus sp.]
MRALPETPRKSAGADVRVSKAVRWYVWDGGFLAVGRATGIVPPHSHHAIQIVIALEGEIAVRGADEVWRTGRGVIIGPDIEHSYDARDAFAAMLFVDPESTEGIWLRSSLRDDITLVPESRVLACTVELTRFRDHPMESMEVGALIRHCVQSLSAGAPPARRLDPRVTRVLQQIQRSNDLRVSLESAATAAFLSPSRFAHLFKQQLGLPFRRYLLWRKVTRAMLVIGREGTATAAAHAADFADAAHLTRTFCQMFGIPPSVFLRGTFFEIPAPFAYSVTDEKVR